MADKEITIAIATDSIKLRDLKNQINDINKALEKTSDVNAYANLIQESKKLEAQTDELEASLRELNKASLGVNATFEQIYGDLQPLNTRLGEMEDRLYELAKAGQEGTEEFQALIKEVADSKRVIKEVDEQVDALAENGGFSFVSAGLGSIGSSLASLDFEKAAKQAGQLQDRISKIKPEDVKKQMDALNSTFKSLGSITGSALGGLVKNIGSVGKVFASFGKALLLNPIFIFATIIAAIVVAIVALLQKFGLLKPIVEAVGKVFKFFGDIIDVIVQAIKDFLDFLGLTDFAVEENAKKTVEANDKKLASSKKVTEGIVDDLQHEIEIRKINGENTVQAEKNVQKVIIQRAASERALILEKINALKKVGELSDEQKEQLKQAREEYAEVIKTIKEGKQELQLIDAQDKKDKKEKAKEDAEQAKADAKEAAQRAKQAAQNRLNASRQIRDIELSLLKDGVDKELAVNAEKYKRMLEDLKRDETKNSQEKTKIRSLLIKQEENEASKIRSEEIKKQDEKLIKANQERSQNLADLLAIIEEAENKISDATLKEQERAKNAVRDTYFERIEAARAAGLDITALEKAQQMELDAIDKEYTKKLKEEKLQRNANTLQGQKDLLQYQLEQELANTNLTEEEKEKIKKKYRDLALQADIAAAQMVVSKTLEGFNLLNDAIKGFQEVKMQNAEQDTAEANRQVEAAQKALDSAGNASEAEKKRLSDNLEAAKKNAAGKAAAEEKLAKKQFEINKKLQIAQAVIQGIQAVLAAYSSGSSIPIVGAVTGPLFAGLAAVAVGANIAKIKNSKFESSSASADTGSAASGASAASTPSFSLFGGGNQQNNVSDPKDTAINNNITVTAVVSETEVTSTQQKVAKMEKNATL